MKGKQWMLSLVGNHIQGIALSSETGQVVISLPVAERSLPETAHELHAALTAAGYRGEGVLLALDAPRCFPLWMPLASKKQLRRPDSILFQLEELLPDSAEDLVADWVVQGTSIFAVAAHAEPLRAWVEALELAGIPVASITPLVPLAAATHLQHQGGPQIVLWMQEETAELVLVEEPGITRWYSTTADIASVSENLRVIFASRTEPLPIRTYGLAEAELALLSAALPKATVTQSSKTQATARDLAGHTTYQVLAGQQSSPFELRRGPLGTPDRYRAVRRDLTWLTVSIVGLGCTLGGLGLWRAREYQAIRDQAHAKQVELFESLFPRTAVPAAISGRLTSEQTRLTGLRGEGDLPPTRSTAIDYLSAVLRGLPTNLRYRIVAMRMEEDRIQIEGEVRTHTDADVIAKGLEGAGLVVSAPVTHKLADAGFSLRLTAGFPTPVLATSDTGKKSP